MVNSKWISLPNIILNKIVYPEFIQNKCTVQNLYEAINDLLCNNHKYLDQVKKIEKVKNELSIDIDLLNKEVPSIIINHIKSK